MKTRIATIWSYVTGLGFGIGLKDILLWRASRFITKTNWCCRQAKRKYLQTQLVLLVKHCSKWKTLTLLLLWLAKIPNQINIQVRCWNWMILMDCHSQIAVTAKTTIVLLRSSKSELRLIFITMTPHHIRLAKLYQFSNHLKFNYSTRSVSSLRQSL